RHTRSVCLVHRFRSYQGAFTMSHRFGGSRGSLRRGALVAKRTILSIITSSLLAASISLLPNCASGGPIFQFAGPTVSGDDILTGAVGPYQPIPVSSIVYADPFSYLNGQCIWINSALNAYVAANPVNGFDPSGQVWRYRWAPLAVERSVQSGITV